MGFGSRLPTPNEPPRRSTNPWGSQNPDYDDFAALLNGDAVRCAVCRCVVMKEHQRVKDGFIVCPEHGTEKAFVPTKQESHYGASSDSDFDAD